MSNIQPIQPATYLWRHLGTFHKSTGIASSAVAIAGFSTAATGFYRIDYASLIIDYHQGDLDCSCDMLLNLGDDVLIPFLSVSASPVDPAATPYAQNRWMAQLTLPFYVSGNFGIFIQGESALLSLSTIWATACVSSSWAP